MAKRGKEKKGVCMKLPPFINVTPVVLIEKVPLGHFLRQGLKVILGNREVRRKKRSQQKIQRERKIPCNGMNREKKGWGISRSQKKGPSKMK